MGCGVCFLWGYTEPTEVAGEVNADNVGARGKGLPDLAKHGAESSEFLAQRRAAVRVARKLDAGYRAQNLRHALADLERARRKARVDVGAVVHAHALGFRAEHPAARGGARGQGPKHRPRTGQQAGPARRVGSLRADTSRSAEAAAQGAQAAATRARARPHCARAAASRSRVRTHHQRRCRAPAYRTRARERGRDGSALEAGRQQRQ